MDATPLLGRVVTALAEQKLETVLIGNAAAAMQGAPVTTVDFDSTIHGVRSFEGLRSRASEYAIGTIKVKVASLPDIIASKRAAGRDRDLAVLPVLEQTLKVTRSPSRHRGS